MLYEVITVSVMTAFNDISGVPSTANHYTITDVLKDDWGFKGFTLSDWDAVIELIPHGIAGNEKEAAEKAINAGTDMEMKSKSYWELLSSVKEGKVKMETIDESVRRITSYNVCYTKLLRLMERLSQAMALGFPIPKSFPILSVPWNIFPKKDLHQAYG